MGKRRRLKKTPLTDGQFVFAKMRGFRAWPGRLVNRLGTEYNVYFYGTWDHARVSQKHIFDFAKHSKRYGKVNDRNSKVCRSFRAAMLEMQLAIAEPELDIGYFNMVAHLTTGAGLPQDESYSELEMNTDSDSEEVPPKGKRIAPMYHIVGDSDSDVENNAPN
ncbi:hepatoma-derived growth factor-like protein 1 [Drosophila obscura]|uniref:hepatoma-derived growth factor-like protein 1 n=1 Tax=Drosophila obscura TaxID=7282 RepID=UPI001BB1FA9A|nr:hepatoma-derived growth factor-like protein 1 [Drosophila obscura]